MDSLKQAARRATQLRPEVTPEDVGATPEQTRVLRGFLDDGRLVSIPAAHGKRMVVLDWLAQQFQPGKVYPESQVNQILQRYHADFAALRRYLVGRRWRCPPGSGREFDLDACPPGPVDRIVGMHASELGGDGIELVDDGEVGRPLPQVVSQVGGQQPVAPTEEDVDGPVATPVAVHGHGHVDMIKEPG
jgi:hypothetical protein